MTAREFSKRMGLFLLLLGLLSLLPGLVGPLRGLPPLRINMSYGRFLGYLPLNLVSKIILIALGIGGLLTAAKKESVEDASIDYARVLFYISGTLASFSWFRDTSTFFGYMPIFSGAGIFFGILSLMGLYFGYFTRRARVHDEKSQTHAV